MRAFLVIGILTLCLTPLSVQAGEHQEQRIEQLEQENMRLVYEISRLRGQIQGQQQRCQSSYRRPYSYGYGQSPMSDATRKMNEAEQMRRSWDRLTR